MLTNTQALFPENFISKKQSEKSKTSQSSTMKQIPHRKETKIRADKDRRPDDIYNSTHLFGVAVPANHLTNQTDQNK